jgi:hypothetical protein
MIKIEIMLNDDGGLGVSGFPDNNALVTFGILELARQQVAAYYQKKAEGHVIQPATMLPPSFGPKQ